MSRRPQVLLIGKVPTIRHFAADDLVRLERAGLTCASNLQQSEQRHLEALDQVRSCLARQADIRERRVNELTRMDFSGCDLVVTVGGDGTTLAVHNYLNGQALLAVNSDPERSVGHYTRCTAESFGSLWLAWREGAHQQEFIPRLCVGLSGSGERHQLLNDALFTSRNPAAMTRYRLHFQDHSEDQFSSGVWISSAAGSTAAYQSAGGEALEPHRPALLFRVREPFHGRGQLHLLDGRALPPVPLQLTAAMPGIRLYIDGSHTSWSVPPGVTVTCEASPSPLCLIASPG